MRLRVTQTAQPPFPAVTVLKPLHGDEPGLLRNLTTLLAQDYPAATQIVFGVTRADDGALAAVETLRASHPEVDIKVVVDGRRHGTNNKLSNLANMLPHARYDLLVIADSDVAMPPDTLSRVAAMLGEDGTGLVTCLPHGRGDAGAWSRLAAMDISYRFLPSVALAAGLGRPQPCLGPMMALKRETLDRTGGFAAMADALADDHALGEAVRGLGLGVVSVPMPIAHCCPETALAAVIRHELRWSLTIFRLAPFGFTGGILLHCLPLALLAVIVTHGSALAWVLLGASVAARLAVVAAVDHHTGERSAPWWWLPVRDALSFAVFLATFFVQTVDWRGARFRVARDGRLIVRARIVK